MGDASARDDRIFGVQLAAVAALIGAIVGAVVYISLSGVIFGMTVGLGLCGLLMLAASVLGFPLSVPAAIRRNRPAVVQAAVGNAANIPPATGVASAIVQAANTGTDPIADSTETEAEMLSKGRFAEYHLSKAKRFFAAGNHKDAAYQAGASLAHGDLKEAADIRKRALAGGR